MHFLLFKKHRRNLTSSLIMHLFAMPMKIAYLKWEVKILCFEAADHQEKSKVCPEQFKTN